MDKETELVLSLTEYDKIRWIGSIAVLRVEQWHDDFRHWRAGVNWFGENDYDFICEKPTLEECLDCILMNQKYWNPRKKIKNP